MRGRIEKISQQWTSSDDHLDKIRTSIPLFSNINVTWKAWKLCFFFTIACQSGCLPIDWEANQQRNNDPSWGTSSRKLGSDILSLLTYFYRFPHLYSTNFLDSIYGVPNLHGLIEKVSPLSAIESGKWVQFIQNRVWRGNNTISWIVSYLHFYHNFTHWHLTFCFCHNF